MHAVRAAVEKEMPASKSIGVGSQNVYFQKNGAFTGEISIEMLLDLGLTHVILGHSERRQFMGETDEIVNQKLTAVLSSALIPILCVGETLAEREAGQTTSVVSRQVEGAFRGISAELATRVIVAYEPVWAIGTGKQPVQLKPKRFMVTFANCWKNVTIPGFPKRFESFTAGASRRTTRQNSCRSPISTGPWSAVRHCRLKLF